MRIPRPACNWIIDNGRPNEHENDAWEHPSALCDSACGKCYCDRREHSLIYREKEVRNSIGTDRWLREDVLEAEVGEVANERTSCVRERQGIPPKEPLKTRDRRCHD